MSGVLQPRQKFILCSVTRTLSMIRTFSLSILLLASVCSHAQVAIKIWAEPAELKALSKRTLVVELPEENPKVTEGFPKKTAESDAAAYRASLASYREHIEPAVRKY